MEAAVAANETNQAAAAASGDSGDDIAIIMPAAKLVDPQLLMAARRGDGARLTELLQLNIEEEEEEEEVLVLLHGSGSNVNVESSAAAVILEVQVSPDDERPPALDGVTASEGDTLLHVVAECGDNQDFTRCASLIAIHHKRSKGGAAALRRALQARNSKGDTPLHRAAGAGNANMIGHLIDLAADDATALLRTQNERRETALHQAVRAPSNRAVACIDELMAVDPELACIPHEDGASPLYLAISLGEIKIARHLYVKSRGKLSYSGPDGRNVLHAAVPRWPGLPMILGWLIKDVKLTRELTGQRDKQQKGSTPLHLAASLAGWSVVRGAKRSLQDRPLSATALLLDANPSTAYQVDDQGWYPIHVAAHAGSLDVVKLLLERCPDCATLRDDKGRTFLHVAAAKERYAVVRYVAVEMPQRLSFFERSMPQRLSSMILNAQDSNGDTAPHAAVRAGNLAVFNCLFRNPRVCLELPNKEGMTPLDLSYTMIPAGFYYALNPRTIVRSSLIAAGAPHGGDRPDLFLAKNIPECNLDEESKKHTEATQVTSIVTALIATVTFASAFTLPGGYRADDGAPLLAGNNGNKSYAFDAFILADTLAFLFSITATCTLVYAGLPAMDISIRNWYFNLSASLLQSAARSLVAAFGLGLYLVLAPVDRTAAVAVCAIIFATSLYANMAARQVIGMATAVLARLGFGFPRPLLPALLRGWARSIFFLVSVHFGSYVIIFGLPAIRK